MGQRPWGRRLVVLARWPAPGRCKRRLSRSCGSAVAAARMQAMLTQHTLAVGRAACSHGRATLQLAADGLGPGALARWGRGLGADRSVAQGGGSLGCRMQRQLRRAFGEGEEQVLLIGSDLPGLECGDLSAAFSALEREPLVLGPAGDGGYWLIGLNRQGFERAGAGLMSGLPWGTARVLADTLARAESLGLTARLLRQQDDLDHRDDLRPWLRAAAEGWRP